MKLTVASVAAFTLLNAGGVFAAATHQSSNAEHSLTSRAERCGVGIGKCAPGFCCSGSGFCGKSKEFCEGSQCQLEFCDSCDTFYSPFGSTTENIQRPYIGKAPYGTVISECKEPGVLALTYDDGPYFYTPQLLDILEKNGIRATFFISGNNRGKGRIDDENRGWPKILRKMHESGHQLASHTWTHRDLNKVNSTIQYTEMVYNEMAFRNIFGWFPTYMRPPYLECSVESGCVDMMETLGYHIITNNIDTKDYENDDAKLIAKSKERFDAALSVNASDNDYITLSHDVHYQTVVNLTEHIISIAKARGYRMATVGECLRDPPENWYRNAPMERTPTTRSLVAQPLTSSGTSEWAKPTVTSIISMDQRCGGDQGNTCQGSQFGNCCSFYGYCGNSSEYCGTGCDPNFGSCSPVNGGITETTNGLCGIHFSATCEKYGAKTCCSQYGFCGNTDAHCGQGCQKGFGNCN